MIKKPQKKEMLTEGPVARGFDKAKVKKALLLVLIFAVGSGIGAVAMRFVIEGQVENAYKQIRPIREKNSHYKYTNPLLACGAPNSKEFFTNLSLENKINDLASQEKTDGKIDSISVYYRDLVYGRWVGINENQKYDPASMLKVAIMIAFYKQSEEEPNILQKQITYTPGIADTVQAVPYQTPSELQIGESYPIEKLIEAMIVDSDNGAKNILLKNIDNQSLSEVYTDLGLMDPGNVSGNYTISAKSYSLFLRILYNASYLNSQDSEKALGLLVKAQYKDGLVAGVPFSTVVAQKFGEHVEGSDNSGFTYELHDCGIVYKPDMPYLLCVMTKGTDLTEQTRSLQEISRLVYNNSDI